MYQYAILPHFQQQIKFYEKKFHFIRQDIITQIQTFSPLTADHLGNNVYKIRFKVSGLNKGKRNAFRLLLVVVEAEKLIVPVAFYHKGER